MPAPAAPKASRPPSPPSTPPTVPLASAVPPPTTATSLLPAGPLPVTCRQAPPQSEAKSREPPPVLDGSISCNFIACLVSGAVPETSWPPPFKRNSAREPCAARTLFDSSTLAGIVQARLLSPSPQPLSSHARKPSSETRRSVPAGCRQPSELPLVCSAALNSV